FDNLNAERGYGSWPAYGRSKLANLLFTAELARRGRPGYAVLSAYLKPVGRYSLTLSLVTTAE
ncbi:short-chain dehydrogenase, partial [Streptomyces albidoflavus]